MSGDSELKSADQSERLKLLLEESRSDSEKAAMLIELLETGFFNANSQLESEDDSGDGVEEVRGSSMEHDSGSLLELANSKILLGPDSES
jgi:hypothetical protein